MTKVESFLLLRVEHEDDVVENAEQLLTDMASAADEYANAYANGDVQVQVLLQSSSSVVR
jgi:hypothetical protein